MSAIYADRGFEKIKSDIVNRRFKPIYLLMGEETHFIDELTNLLTNSVLSEAEKDFNMLTFYGADSDVNEIISSARRYPMMADYLLIIVKEAQNLNNFELFDIYAKKPMPTTILVINYKHGRLDKRRAVVKKINNIGVLFESKKLYDNQIPGFIILYLRDKGIDIDYKSAQMLTDYVGNDISKLIPQIQKLELSLPLAAASRCITAEMIETNVGISKDYNNFELVKAVAVKDVYAANRILDYFSKNLRDNPMVITVAVLFNYFSNLLECFWLPRKDEYSVGNALNIRSSYIISDYTSGLANYSAKKVIDIIAELRRIDAQSKGFEAGSATEGDLLKELLFKIMH